jgi:hypothetical protein
MDFAALLNYHRERGADVTIATTPADEDHAAHLGIIKVWGWRLLAVESWWPLCARAYETVGPVVMQVGFPGWPAFTLPPPQPRRPPPPSARRNQVDEAMNVLQLEEKPPSATLHTMTMDAADLTSCYG